MEFTKAQKSALKIAHKLFAIGYAMNCNTSLSGEACRATFAAARATLEATFSREAAAAVYGFEIDSNESMYRSVAEWTKEVEAVAERADRDAVVERIEARANDTVDNAVERVNDDPGFFASQSVDTMIDEAHFCIDDDDTFTTEQRERAHAMVEEYIVRALADRAGERRGSAVVTTEGVFAA